MITKTRNIIESIDFTEDEKKFLRGITAAITNGCRNYEHCEKCPFYDISLMLGAGYSCGCLAGILDHMADNGGVKNN